jgi:outer membrane receptor protein involved in Fe transport
MKGYSNYIAALLVGLGGLAPVWGQTAATTAAKDEPVALPQFVVTETKTNVYQSPQALSASRLALPILDIPQTISVVPKELIEDALGNRMLDVAKFVTPLQENTLPFGGDRYTIRGFTVSAEFIDGTMISHVHWRSYVPASRPAVPANNLASITYPYYQYAAIMPGFTTDNRGVRHPAPRPQTVRVLPTRPTPQGQRGNRIWRVEIYNDDSSQ